jgi:hypothetical protein
LLLYRLRAFLFDRLNRKIDCATRILQMMFDYRQ